MKPFNPQRRTLLTTAASLTGLGASLAITSGCASLDTPTQAPADVLAVRQPRVGDRWRYARINLYNKDIIGEERTQVTAVTPDIQISVEREGALQATEDRFTQGWMAQVDSLFGEALSFEEAVPIVPPSLYIGLRLRHSTRYRSVRNSEPLAWSQQLRVVGRETVGVAAGRFDAYRIERQVQFVHPDTFRMDSQRTEVLWYAPEVGRWVIREWRGSYLDYGMISRLGRSREGWERLELIDWKLAA
jgi:hypothetical protein